MSKYVLCQFKKLKEDKKITFLIILCLMYVTTRMEKTGIRRDRAEMFFRYLYQMFKLYTFRFIHTKVENLRIISYLYY